MRNWEKLKFTSETEERAAFEEFLDEKRSDTIIPVDTDIDEFNLLGDNIKNPSARVVFYACYTKFFFKELH